MFGATRPRKRNLTIPIAAGLLIAMAAAGTVFVLTRKQSAAATPVPVASVAQSQTQPMESASEPAAAVAPPLTETLREFAPAAATETVDEQAIINEEVRRRLAAERVRLDQQRAQQLAAQQAAERAQRTPSAPRIDPRDAVPQATQTVPPQITPAQTQPDETLALDDTTSAAATATQQVPVTLTQEPAPPPVAKQGDFVAAGTPGLVEPVLISMKKVSYPPIARMHKVGGNVIISVLVSETGRVIESKILRGISQNVGINEAALEMARGATFQPATKDGVRVKANKTLVVPFKL